MQVERCSLALSWLIAATLLGCSDDGNPTTDENAGTDDEVGETNETSGDGDGESGTESGSESDTSTDDPSTETDTSTDDPTTETTDTSETTDESTGDGDGDPQGDDYDQPGPYAVSDSTATMQVSPQCNLEYGIFEPNTLLSDTPVLLAHGFMRSIEAMAPTAEHIASWGVKVYTVPLCTNSFQINHQQNGEAMAALGEALAPEGAVYAGFSAGGLAAFVATAEANNAVAYVGLDAVDNNGLAGQVVGQVGVPVRGMIAEPGQCNTNNNFLPVYDQIAGAPVIKVVDAQHFDFETDACGIGDFGCTFCAPNGPDTRATALGLTTAAVLVETGADLGGETWWEPGGSYFDDLVQQGKITLIP